MWEVGGRRALLNWSVYPGRDRCSGELPTTGGKVDMAGGVWEAEPGVHGDIVGVGCRGPGRCAQPNCRHGTRGLWLPSIPAREESP